jgi:serine/threonine-protein kinase
MPEGDRSAQAQLQPHARTSESWGMLGTRYKVFGEIASGGMATVQYGRLIGPRGFARAVAIKRMHPHFARDPDFVSMFVDEARLSARLVHANIIPTLDVVETPGELALVMEYVHGESLWTLLRLSAAEGRSVPVRVACALIASVLYGLHAAHETRDESGQPLDIVHRDVSPQNILVGADGIPRVLDFGIAKAIGQLRSTPSGEIKGKLSYISPEQLHAEDVDRRADIYGASAVLWEILVGHALFDGPTESSILHSVLNDVIPVPSSRQPECPARLDAIVMRGLNRDPAERFATAREMAFSLEHDVGLATQSEVSDWLQALAGGQLADRALALAHMQEAANDAPLLAGGLRSSTPSSEFDGATPPPAEVVAVASDQTGRRSARPRIPLWPWLPLTAALLLAALTWLFTRHPHHSSAAAPLVLPAPARSAPLQPSAADPTLPASPGSQPSAGVSAPAPTAAEDVIERGIAPPPVEPAPPPKLLRPHREPHTARAKPSKPQCKPYYYIDDQGIRRPKPGCL